MNVFRLWAVAPFLKKNIAENAPKIGAGKN